MGTTPLHWEIRNRVGHIVLNCPERANVIDASLAQALARVAGQAGSAAIGAVLISARGKQFSAGGDIAAFVQHRCELEPMIAQMLELLHPTMHQLAQLPMPVISAIQGSVGGGGIGLGLCADMVLASTSAYLRGGYSAIGLSPDLGVSYYLTRRAGAARAKYLLMSNQVLNAQECLRLGLFDELHAPDQLLAAATQLAESLAAGPGNSLAGIKKLCNSAMDHGLKEHLDAERDAMLACARNPNSLEGVNAFMEKRPAVFVPQ
ncbi:MAG: enoyl-CoA hydratase-related protein [Comamonas sp.]